MIATLSLTACTPVSSASPAASSAAPKKPQTPNLNVGVLSDLPGLGLFDPASTTRSGFDVDLYRWLGNSEPKFTPVPVDLTIPDRLDALREKRVQLVVAAFSITDDRRKQIGFAGPYLITHQGIMVRTGDKRIQAVSDLAGKVVCAQKGSTSLAQLNNTGFKGQMTITEMDGSQQCIDSLMHRQVDAVSTDQLILYGFAKKYGADVLSVVPGLTFGAKEEYGIGLPHGDKAMCDEFTRKIRDFIINGLWDGFFRSNFGASLTPSDYKPDPYRLNRCD
jgi:glutamate transport system substrate-binding protein